MIPSEAFSEHLHKDRANSMRMIISLLAYLAFTSPAAGYPIILKRSHFDCLTQNLEVYLAMPDNPIIIFLDLCPDPRTDIASLSRLSKNLRKTGDVGVVEGTTNVISLSKSELICLGGIQDVPIETKATTETIVITKDQIRC